MMALRLGSFGLGCGRVPTAVFPGLLLVGSVLLTGCGDADGEGGGSGTGGSGTAAGGSGGSATGSGASASSSGGTPAAGGASGGSTGTGGASGGSTSVGGDGLTDFEPTPALIDPIAACSEQPRDCGGDPTGAWSWVAECADWRSCDGYAFQFGTFEAVITLAADGTYQTSQATITSSTLTPFDCVPALAQSCDQIDGCSIAGEACDCTVTQNIEPESGQWAVSGNQMRVQKQGNSSASQQTFCVDGNHMQMWQLTEAGLAILTTYERVQ